MMKKYVVILFSFFAFCVVTIQTPISSITHNNDALGIKDKTKENYGVFIGLDRKNTSKLFNYKKVVIEGTEFTKNDIKKLHIKGVKVFSYLNIGAIEKARGEFPKFKKFSLGEYKGWKDERWMDTSNKNWQKNLLDKANKLKNKNFDGLFLDNLDVWEVYKQNKIYKGILDILKTFKKIKVNKKSIPIIVNGGDHFLKRAIKTEDIKKTSIKGINQESVYSIMGKKGNSKAQAKDVTLYYEKFFKTAQNNKLKVFIIEYINKTKTKFINKVKLNAKKLDLEIYISSSRNLN